MFARFVYALLSFHTRKFPLKFEKKTGHLLLTEGCKTG